MKGDNDGAIAALLAGALMMAPASARACKVLVKYPAHLEGLTREDAENYLVVRVETVLNDGYTGRVERSFNPAYSAGAGVEIRFRQDEEAHAMCPLQLVVGQAYLLRSTSRGGPVEISRFGGRNIRSSSEHFAAYVQDIAEAHDR